MVLSLQDFLKNVGQSSIYIFSFPWMSLNKSINQTIQCARLSRLFAGKRKYFVIRTKTKQKGNPREVFLFILKK